MKLSTTKKCHHTTGTLAKMFSSSLLQSALFCASAIMSGGSCLMAVVANLRIQICGHVWLTHIQVTNKIQAKTGTYTMTLTWADLGVGWRGCSHPFSFEIFIEFCLRNIKVSRIQLLSVQGTPFWIFSGPTLINKRFALYCALSIIQWWTPSV